MRDRKFGEENGNIFGFLFDFFMIFLNLVLGKFDSVSNNIDVFSAYTFFA